MGLLRKLWRSMQAGEAMRIDTMAPFRPPVSPDPEDAAALERAWQRRQAELGEWAPSQGWLTDQVKP